MFVSGDTRREVDTALFTLPIGIAPLAAATATASAGQLFKKTTPPLGDDEVCMCVRWGLNLADIAMVGTDPNHKPSLLSHAHTYSIRPPQHAHTHTHTHVNKPTHTRINPKALRELLLGPSPRVARGAAALEPLQRWLDTRPKQLLTKLADFHVLVYLARWVNDGVPLFTTPYLTLCLSVCVQAKSLPDLHARSLSLFVTATSLSPFFPGTCARPSWRSCASPCEHSVEEEEQQDKEARRRRLVRPTCRRRCARCSRHCARKDEDDDTHKTQTERVCVRVHLDKEK